MNILDSEGTSSLQQTRPHSYTAFSLYLVVCVVLKQPTHVKVNCWFCNQDTVVLSRNRNSWDCPTCEQYNGFQENGDYNKPIPAQYSEHMNHGTCGKKQLPESPKTLQWVNCQMLLCKKCNTNQALKIKQLASFTAKEDTKYDKEVEVYKRYLEQIHKLCRPCEAAVKSYIKHQNRQLRGLLFNHRLRHKRTEEEAFGQNTSSPSRVVFLRALAFIVGTLLLAAAASGSRESVPVQPPPQFLSGGISVTRPEPNGGPAFASRNSSSGASSVWPEFLGVLLDETMERMRLMWNCSTNHQMAMALFGLSACIMTLLLTRPIRLTKIDTVASILWLVVMGAHLVENYLTVETSTWLHGIKISSTFLCCLVAFSSVGSVFRIRPVK
uniref:Transmembrane protein 201 n=1 Tax=Scleropages formosus TaxID=113540 RepID=A0A8C9U4S6_SCLFO